MTPDNPTFATGWLRPLESGWPRTICHLLESGRQVARIVVAEVRGSAPREPGACMLVSSEGCFGTIGGGRLEWQAMQAADALLREPAASSPVRLSHLTLGPDLGQCCGGVVRIWLERFASSDLPVLHSAAQMMAANMTPYIATTLLGGQEVRRQILLPQTSDLLSFEERIHALQPRARRSVDDRVLFGASSAHDALLLERIDHEAAQLWLFGAGHVGQALVRVLTDLPFEITWIDERTQLLPADLSPHVRTWSSATPLATLQSAPPGARYLVMTHDHALDYSLCRSILERGTFGWLGLIGSQSKGARFRARLARDGVSAALIERLTCPIGVDGVDSKWPAAIAVGVAAQLLQGLGKSRTHSQVSVCATTDCQTCSSAPVHSA
jgi:xanthine dehydrogenase accessory factor